MFFLHKMRDKDLNDREVQKQLIETFVNSIFLYDDKIIITFNYSGDNRTLTLSDLDSLSTDGEVFGHRALCSTKGKILSVYDGIFSLDSSLFIIHCSLFVDRIFNE